MSAAVASLPSHLDSPQSPLSPDGGNHSTRWQNAAHGSSTQLVSGTEQSQKWKGKGKEIASADNEDEGLSLEHIGRDSVDHDDEEDEEEVEGGATSYPPMHDDELEERRIAENLKRWETADRLKRKSIRESRSGTSPTSPKSSSESAVKRTSLLWNDVTQRITLVRPGNQHERRGSMTSQMPLRGAAATGEEDSLSMDDRQTRSSTGGRNPFDTPRGGSPVRAHEETGALMSSNPSTPIAGPSHQQQLQQLSSARPVLPAMESSFDTGKGGQPRPIDIPQAVSPPPTRSVPIDVPGDPDDEHQNRGRWWTEWLCGCREEGQHGDGAAGRTNPFE